LKCQVGDLLWQRKHDVEICVHGQQFRFPFSQPLRPSASLALRTTPVVTRNGEISILPFRPTTDSWTEGDFTPVDNACSGPGQLQIADYTALERIDPPDIAMALA
jgi:hypothetical protein